jgi:argonaute-like protein implicated in RNA metabolism and viral defense
MTKQEVIEAAKRERARQDLEDMVGDVVEVACDTVEDKYQDFVYYKGKVFFLDELFATNAPPIGVKIGVKRVE